MRRCSSDREDARAPGTAGRLDRDLVAGLVAHERATDRRVGRDTADARDLDLHALSLLVLDLDARADAHGVSRDGGLVDDDSPVQPVTEHRDAALEQALLVLRRVVLEVLREVAEA